MEFSFTAQILLAAAVALAAGLVRGITGFGGAMVMAPSLSLVLGPTTAVVIALALETAAAAIMLPQAWPQVRWRALAPIGLAAVLTIPAGAWLLATADRDLVRRLIAGMVVLFAGLMALGWRYRGEPRVVVAMAMGALSGVLAGATSMGGPPVILYLLAGPDPVERTRATLVVFISAISAIALAMLAAFGIARPADALWCAGLAPLFLAATWFGGRLFHRLGDRGFRRFALAFLLILSGGLLLV